MDAKTMEKLKHMICAELDEIGNKKTLTPTDVEQLYKMTDIVKNLEKIEMLEDGMSDDGYSRTGKWDMHGEYGRGYSGRRHRDSRGRYASDSYHYPIDYSRDSGKMMHLLDEMMDEATTEHQREAIRKCKAELR